MILLYIYNLGYLHPMQAPKLYQSADYKAKNSAGV